MARRIWDFNTPHIIGGKRERYRERGRRRRGMGRTIVIALIVATIIAGLAFGIYLYGPSYFRLSKADYYALTLTRTDSLKAAEDASKAVSAAGGAGYILNDGDFLVAAFVYKKESDAKVVLDRFSSDYPDAGLRSYQFGRTRVRRSGDRGAEAKLRELLNYPLKLVDELIGYVYALDSFESGESAVMLKVEGLKSDVKARKDEAEILAAGRAAGAADGKAEERATACYRATAEFYEDIYDSLCGVSLLSGAEKKLTHRLKNVCCELVEKYWGLRERL
ncbi:MAG: hypothetical protein FWE84_02785 [Firmicutes bacterium]|nr:hypothetical protein [Bacillota bacterium]